MFIPSRGAKTLDRAASIRADLFFNFRQWLNSFKTELLTRMVYSSDASNIFPNIIKSFWTYLKIRHKSQLQHPDTELKLWLTVVKFFIQCSHRSLLRYPHCFPFLPLILQNTSFTMELGKGSSRINNFVSHPNAYSKTLTFINTNSSLF